MRRRREPCKLVCLDSRRTFSCSQSHASLKIRRSRQRRPLSRPMQPNKTGWIRTRELSPLAEGADRLTANVALRHMRISILCTAEPLSPARISGIVRKQGESRTIIRHDICSIGRHETSRFEGAAGPESYRRKSPSRLLGEDRAAQHFRTRP